MSVSTILFLERASIDLTLNFLEDAVAFCWYVVELPFFTLKFQLGFCL